MAINATLFKKTNGIPKAIDPVTTIEQVTGLGARLDALVEKADGKGLSTNDFTTLLLNKLNALENYDDSALSQSITTLQGRLDILVSGNATTAIDSFNEITNFLSHITDSTTLEGIIAGINDAITAERNRALAAESTLQSNINAEATRASEAEASLSGAQSAESSSRASEDSAIRTDLLAESTNRTNADTTLTNNLNSEISRASKLSNELNLDILYPLQTGYYTLATAIAVVIDPTLKKSGVKLTFSTAAGIYETWQLKTSISGWSTASNWDRILVSGRFGNTDLVTDLNTIQRSGKYTAYGTAANVPNSSYSWFVDHINSSIGTQNAYQKAVAYNSTIIIYERTLISNVWGSWTLVPSRAEVNTNTSDISELKLGSGFYCISGWDPNNLSPTPTTTKGNQTWLRDLSHVYLFDMTQNTGTTMRPVGELQRANWLRYVDGTFAPVIGITEAMRAVCDVALYLDAAHTTLYSAAGAFNATTFYNAYGMTQKLYDASGNEVRILRPWETTSTNYSIGIGFSEKVWLIDGLGTSGTYWQGLSQHEITWDGVKGVVLERTAINPCPVTTYGGKTRSFFYLYNTGDSNTVSAIGKNNLCTLFSGLGRTFPRVTDMHQITNMTYARANNSVATNPYPAAEGGYHALNAAITRREVLFGTRYLHNPSLFGSGISSNDTCNNEATFLANGGFKYKVSTDTTFSYCGLGSNPSIYYNASAGITNASDFLNQQYPKEQCLESQMVASFAKETGVAANTDFAFYASTYQYRNVTGALGLADGRMNVIVTKVMSQTISAFNVSGVATLFDIAVCLRMSLCDGINESGDIFMYQGGGYEQVGTCVSTVQPHTGDTVDLYLQPDQKSWTNTTDVTKNNLGTFDFEKLYVKLGTATNLGDNYTKTRQSLTPWKTINGGGLSTGQCFYVWDNNYWSTTLQQRVRIAARFRGYAYFGYCSPRYMNAFIAVTFAHQAFGGSAQILIG